MEWLNILLKFLFHILLIPHHWLNSDFIPMKSDKKIEKYFHSIRNEILIRGIELPEILNL